MRRWLENRLLGDARHRGETHQWAYDRHTLTAKLQRTGYSAVRSRNSPGWLRICPGLALSGGQGLACSSSTSVQRITAGPVSQHGVCTTPCANWAMDREWWYWINVAAMPMSSHQ
jgi:hypothetical protein